MPQHVNLGLLWRTLGKSRASTSECGIRNGQVTISNLKVHRCAACQGRRSLTNVPTFNFACSPAITLFRSYMEGPQLQQLAHIGWLCWHELGSVL